MQAAMTAAAVARATAAGATQPTWAATTYPTAQLADPYLGTTLTAALPGYVCSRFIRQKLFRLLLLIFALQKLKFYFRLIRRNQCKTNILYAQCVCISTPIDFSTRSPFKRIKIIIIVLSFSLWPIARLTGLHPTKEKGNFVLVLCGRRT